MSISGFSQNSSFWRENRLFYENPVLELKFQLFGPKRTLPARGLQKTSQKLMFIKGSEPGPQKTDSGPKSDIWAPEMLRMVKFRSFLVEL